MQAASKIDQGRQAWIALAVLDIDHSAEAQVAMSCQLLQGHAAILANAPEVHSERVEHRVGQRRRHDTDLITRASLTTMNSCA
ncbi:hypothetical protein NI25_32895 [Streptomyces sp. CCM_MD2014]|nr:hypothetical protein NI25_32895 [Streptomyces sp. CCM_MD2014]